MQDEPLEQSTNMSQLPNSSSSATTILPADVPLPDIKSLPDEERMMLAVTACQASGLKADGSSYNYSIRRAAEDFSVSRTSLSRRLAGV
jgi:hypothetical protein